LTITIKTGKGITHEQSIKVLKMLHTHLFVSNLTSGTADSGAIAAAMESSLLFCGHVLVILCNENRKTPIPTFNEHLAVVLQLSAKRAINSNLPSCIKSFILPIAYNAALVPDTVSYLGSL
jgi:hypothetical protein